MMYTPKPGYEEVSFYPDTGQGPSDVGVGLPSGALLLFLEFGDKSVQSDTWADMAWYSKFLWNDQVGWVFRPNLEEVIP